LFYYKFIVTSLPKILQHNLAKRLLFFCIFSIAFIGSAQNNITLKGIIRDKKTSEKLIGATVSVKGTSIGTSTNFDGEFTLKVSGLPVKLVVSYIGYRALETEVITQTKLLDIRISENTQQLKDVEIRDSRITEKQKQAPLTVETMDALSIKETPAANFYEGLAHLKGVDLTSASIGFKIINTRGFNSTSPVRSLQLIDGVDNQSPGLNFALGNFLGASELDIQRVDLVVGASGAYYGPNAFNGVINMQTKNPFLFPGLSASVKVGERNLTETAVRWADTIKSRKGEERFAYKINLFYLRANDWEATNYEPTIQSRDGIRNPGGYDAVNIYGDEYQTANQQAPGFALFTGLNRFYRTGYKEVDLVDYNTQNIKASTSLHYKVTPKIEAIYAFNMGNGTTVYQGDNRFSLKDIYFFQNRIELRKEDDFFIRAYATNEDAGNSYDAYNTALRLQGYAKRDQDWSRDYKNQWSKLPSDIQTRIDNLQGMPQGSFPFPPNFIQSREDFLLNNFYDSIVLYHMLAAGFANGANNAPGDISLNSQGSTAVPYFEPGTARFDSAFNSIISKKSTEGGSRFFDRSALYHIMGEKRFKINTYNFVVGANFRQYRPNSEGTIFLDTGNTRITNWEVGSFIGIEKKVIDDKLKITATVRGDKNQNFMPLLSPAISLVFSQNRKHVVRTSFSSAIRNPTLTDQYFYLPVGRAVLLGNLNGFENLTTIESVQKFRDSPIPTRDSLVYFNVDAVKPERVRTIEFGYRAELFNKLYLDLNYYFSIYQDFLGFKIGVNLVLDSLNFIQPETRIYRVTTNSKDIVTTQGFSAGLNYYFQKYLGISGNYSWNVLDRRNSTDPLIPAFNTPEHKYNIGISGRDITLKLKGLRSEHWGYNINYKWVEGFLFEGSPQFTGFVPTYDMIDAQINKKFIRKYTTTLKLGANNLLNNKQIQVYGGPRIGRMIYLSILLEF
jgi:iron complex outermembrane recepter protein